MVAVAVAVAVPAAEVAEAVTAATAAVAVQTAPEATVIITAATARRQRNPDRRNTKKNETSRGTEIWVTVGTIESRLVRPVHGRILPY